jgi:hypothetical protein
MITAKCYCDNCGEYILDINLESLESPLKGHMFVQREDTEWAIFHESYEQTELTCPICEWLLHTEGVIDVEIDGERHRGMPNAIKSLVNLPEKEVEKPKITFKCRHCKKVIKEGKYCSDECMKADFKEQGKPKRGYTKGKRYNVEEAHKVPKGQGMMNKTKETLKELLDG